MTGVPGVRLSLDNPLAPSKRAVLATTEKSFVSIWALSTTFLSISKACAIASRTMPSPTPILNSSVIVLVKYFASVAEACDNNSKMISNDDGEEIFTESHVSYRNDFDHPGRRVVKVRNKPPVDTTFKRKISHNVESHSQVNNVSHKSRITKFQRDIPKQNPQTKYESNGVSNKGDISNHESKINRSSKNIQFESNDLLEEYKK